MSKVHEGRPRVRVAVLVFVSVLSLAVDQATKLWALRALGDGRSVRVVDGLLSLTLVRNPGASLGFGSGATWVISLLAVCACAALLVFALRATSMSWTLAFAFAFSGAFGNLIDRVAYAQGFLDGKVVDFLDYGWSVGNIADVYLVFAGVAIVVMILLNVPYRTIGSGRQEHDAADGGTDVADAPEGRS